MMTPPSFSASASAAADFPLAVGPAMMCILGMFVVTLLANPQKERLTQMQVDATARELAAQEVRWLEAGIACEFITNHEPRTTGHDGFDILIQPYPKPRYRLFVADMESTIIENECLDELAEYLGIRPKIEAITARAMNGELDFASALAERVGLLAGLPESTLQEVYDQKVRLMPGAEALLAHLKSQGIHTMLVSGGFSFYTSRIKERLGFDEERSNRLEIVDGKLTGQVLPPILDKNAKLAALMDGCKKLGTSPAQVIAIGDGANDLPMLLAAGLGIAYHAKPSVCAQVKAQLNHCDLSGLIFAITAV